LNEESDVGYFSGLVLFPDEDNQTSRQYQPYSDHPFEYITYDLYRHQYTPLLAASRCGFGISIIKDIFKVLHNQRLQQRQTRQKEKMEKSLDIWERSTFNIHFRLKQLFSYGMFIARVLYSMR
jgi:hypothetical protein